MMTSILRTTMTTLPRTAAIIVSRGSTSIIRNAVLYHAIHHGVAVSETLKNSRVRMPGSYGLLMGHHRHLSTMVGKIDGGTANGHRDNSDGAAQLIKNLMEQLARQGNTGGSKNDVAEEESKIAGAKAMIKKFKNLEKEYPAFLKYLHSFLAACATASLTEYLSRNNVESTHDKLEQLKVDVLEVKKECSNFKHETEIAISNLSHTTDLAISNLSHTTDLAISNLSHTTTAAIVNLSSEMRSVKTETQAAISNLSNEVRSVKTEVLSLMQQQQPFKMSEAKADGNKTENFLAQ